MDESVVTMWLVRAFDGVVNITTKLLDSGLPAGEGAIQHVRYIQGELDKLLARMIKDQK